MPTFTTAYNDLVIYIKESVKESHLRGDNSELSHAELKDIYAEFKLETAFQVKIVELAPILKVPLAFIERLLERMATYSEAYDLRLASCHSMIEQSLGNEVQER